MRFGTILDLECGKCWRVDEYNVGTIYINPQVVGKKDWNPDDAVSYSGYFRCKKCNSAWPFHLTEEAYHMVSELMVTGVFNADDDALQIGETRLFDGTPARSAAQSEEHLKSILEREPDNDFVWSRLGNIYKLAYKDSDAMAAWRKAIEINPKSVEYHHSMGEMLYDKDQWEDSAYHLHQALIVAYEDTATNHSLKRDLVRNALELLLDINDETGGDIPLFPTPEPSSEGHGIETARLESFDLGSERDWERLVDLFMGEERRKPRKTRRR